MFKQKTYKGTKTGFSTATVSVNLAGTTFSSVNAFLTDLFCTTLQTFLKNECKVDCSYDTTTRNFKINGVPYLFMAQNTVSTAPGGSVVYWYMPFNGTTALNNTVSSSTTYMPSFLCNRTTGEYEITLRFLGEPKTSFYLMVMSYVARTTAGSFGFPTGAPFAPYHPFCFSRGKDVFRGRDFFAVSASISVSPKVLELQNGNPVDIGLVTSYGLDGLSYNTIITAKDHQDFPNRLFLKNKQSSYLIWDGHYYVVTNSLNVGNSVTSDTQRFVEVGGETFLCVAPTSILGGVIKIITPD